MLLLWCFLIDFHNHKLVLHRPNEALTLIPSISHVYSFFSLWGRIEKPYKQGENKLLLFVCCEIQTPVIRKTLTTRPTQPSLIDSFLVDLDDSNCLGNDLA